MKQQLTLIDTPRSWRIDTRTKVTGLDGLARARAALADARRAGDDDPPAPFRRAA
ncbi:MAG: hypothetical protein OEU32_11090 [Acidimicrobiia bacterium]|nr:hypothetical protein [Acidimicrobiia bacterium]